MATTPIYAGGARRSAAPTYSPQATLGTAAINYDEGLTNQLLSNFQAPQAAPMSSQAASLAQEPMFGETGGDISTLIRGTNLVNQGAKLTGNQPVVDFGEAGKYMGDAAAVLGARSGEDLAWYGGSKLLEEQIPGIGQYMGSIRALAEGNLEGAVGSGIDAYLYAINPALGLANSAAQFLGMDGVGEAVYNAGSDIFEGVGDVLTDLPVVGGVLEDIGDTFADIFGW